MDLGGASTQLTFTPAVPIKDKNYESNFTLYGNKYNVYTHSYLCYGKEQAMKKVQANLIQQSSNPIDHPCYPTGYQLNTTLGAIFNSPCVSYSGSANLNMLVIFTGTGNASKCQEIIRGIFNFKACGSNTDCTFDGIYQPPISGSFFAFSAFFYTFDILKLTPKASLSVTLDTISKFCQKPWAQVSTCLSVCSFVSLSLCVCASGSSAHRVLTSLVFFSSRPSTPLRRRTACVTTAPWASTSPPSWWTATSSTAHPGTTFSSRRRLTTRTSAGRWATCST
uniref:Ectonucleoside triphosphate diphosphohydrolase 8 n=1 Tax=Erpetoichthys calabaricus TaxID=27687 RepID=A0A8C4T671_ERPCA